MSVPVVVAAVVSEVNEVSVADRDVCSAEEVSEVVIEVGLAPAPTNGPRIPASLAAWGNGERFFTMRFRLVWSRRLAPSDAKPLASEGEERVRARVM